MNQTLNTAFQWLNLGVSPIPVMPKSKIPSVDWRIWQNRTPPIKVVEHWFSKSGDNIGVICGGKRHLCIIDFDDIDYWYRFRSDNINSDSNVARIVKTSYRVRTPRGMHLYCFTDRDENSRKYTDTHVEVRCKGNYTLVPPSIHPSGMEYEPIGKVEDIVTVDTIEDAFPDPVKYFISDEPKKALDIFDLGSQTSIRDIKSRINILTYVGQMTRLTKSSPDGRWWYARCPDPMHRDTHPSFRIDTKFQRAKCLSSKCRLYHDIGLDVIDIHRIIHGISTGQAMQELSMI